MKIKALLPAILIAMGSSRAQVGIGAKTSQSQLDVNGGIRIGNEGKTDAQGKEGRYDGINKKPALKDTMERNGNA